MKILYLGDDDLGGTSAHRADALRRIGSDVTHLNPRRCLRNDFFSRRFNFKTGYTFAQGAISSWMNRQPAFQQQYDLVWIDNGEALGPAQVTRLKGISKNIVNYNCDDPTGCRDGLRWRSLRRALSKYDLVVVVREESRLEYPRYGAKRILKVWRAADEVAHRPREITPEIRAQWSSGVAFVGTWMPERGPLLGALVDAGLPLSIWGGRWPKAPEWKKLRPCWRGPPLTGDNYAYAIQCGQVSLGLLSKGNRDLHTTRTAEIPSLAGLFCAERTTEHVALYVENHEACFWRNADECITLCRRLLGNPAWRDQIAAQGRNRWLRGAQRNEVVAQQVLGAVKELVP